MQQIADEAKVTRATVSMALRDSPEISDEMRERIRSIAKKLGYRLNVVLSTMMSDIRTNQKFPSRGVIAYLNNWPDRNEWMNRPTFSDFFRGAKTRAENLGYELEPVWTKDYKSISILDQALQKRGVKGLLIMPFWNFQDHIDLDWSSYAAATVGFTMSNPSLHYASNHQEQSVRLTFNKLKELGYRKIGVALSHNADAKTDFAVSSRLLLYQSQTPPSQHIPLLNPDSLDEQTFIRWYKKYLPDVIVTMTTYVWKWLRKNGIQVPEDVSLVHLSRVPGDSEFNQWAGVQQFSYEIGVTATELVIGQLMRNELGIPQHPRAIFISSEWVPGISCPSLVKVNTNIGIFPQEL
jgi:DNA-binding LacI/PurR family transcriptional regulator